MSGLTGTHARSHARVRHSHATHHDLILKQKSHRRPEGPHSKEEKGDTANREVTQRGKPETAKEKKIKEQETENMPQEGKRVLIAGFTQNPARYPCNIMILDVFYAPQPT